MLTIDFCGEVYRPEMGGVLVIGRDGDICIDDNLFLHRRFLTISHAHGLWWLSNVGTHLSATIADSNGLVQAWLAPGATLPIVFGRVLVMFTAGPTTYELIVDNSEAPFCVTDLGIGDTGEATVAPVALTHSQRLLIVALAEPQLKHDGTSVSQMRTSREAAARLGWEMTKFNRKLDNVCDKLDRRGVRGLRGSIGEHAVNRRARLVEYAVSTRLVTAADLALLEENGPESAGGVR